MSTGAIAVATITEVVRPRRCLPVLVFDGQDHQVSKLVQVLATPRQSTEPDRVAEWPAAIDRGDRPDAITGGRVSRSGSHTYIGAALLAPSQSPDPAQA